MKAFSDTARWRMLLSLIWPFVGIVLLLVVFGAVSTDVLSSLRAYVGGEGLWTNSQKQATSLLERYSFTADEADYRSFLRAIDVPLGDTLARLELEKQQPDLALVRYGFQRGRNDNADLPGMIRLYRNSAWLPGVARAIAIWGEADRAIAELDAIGAEIHRRVGTGEADVTDFSALRARIRAIDARVTPLESDFSYALGDASRQARLILDSALAGIAVLLVLLALWRTHRMLRLMARSEENSRRSEQRFQRAVRGSSDGLWDWDRTESHLYLSPRFGELLQLDEQDAPRSPAELFARLHPEDRAETLRNLRLHLHRGLRFDTEFRLRLHDGDYRWFHGRGNAERNADGRLLRLSGSISDITDRKIADAQLFAEKERAQVTLESIGDGVVATDVQGSVEYLNPVAESLTGWTTEQARGLPLSTVCRIVDEATSAPVADAVAAVLQEGGAVTLDAKLQLERRQGGSTPIDLTATPIRDRGAEIDGVVLVFRDVSRERDYSEALSYQATHDLLTGLCNRYEFDRRLELALKEVAASQSPHAMLYLDLDQFKLVNDTSGHAAGDELLRQVGVLLQQQVREGDTVARLGGDEFAVLLQHCAPDAALQVAHKLRQAIADQPYHCGRRSFSIGVSIGAVNLAQGPRTLTDVLSLADAACYVAKEKGRNRVHVYHPDDADLSLRQGEMEWVERLHRALDEGRFRLFRQDIVALGVQPENRGSHFEVLLRLQENDRITPPMAFIPAAERYGLMPLIDRWVIRAVCRRLAIARSIPEPEAIDLCAINLSGASLGDEGFADYVRQQFAAFDIVPTQICFEITETAAIANLSRAAEFMQQFQQLGCRFSLDDFGAGMSSFTYLKNLPVDFLKIDGSFVRDLRHDRIDRAMVEAIHRVGQVMGKATIAECVEDSATLRAVREIGIDYAQGFGVARPRPFEIAAAHRHASDGIVR
ncbi:MAG: EAL domain-containing protein [Tahibacter sp.]